MKDWFIGIWALVMLVAYLVSGYSAWASAMDKQWAEASFWVLSLIWMNTVKIGESK